MSTTPTTPAAASPHEWADRAQLVQLVKALRPDAAIPALALTIDGRSIGRTVNVTPSREGQCGANDWCTLGRDHAGRCGDGYYPGAEAVQVDTVHVRWADLELIHELEPMRFGDAVDCARNGVCAVAAARTWAMTSDSTCPATGTAPHATVPDTFHVDCLDCGAELDAIDDAGLAARRRLGDVLDHHNRATVAANLAAMAEAAAP